MSRKNSYAGFTLIELMIVVAIVGILAAVVLPNYSAYVTRGRITEATAALAQQKVIMERWYQDNRNYGPITPSAGACGPAVPTSTNFTYTCAAGTTQTFTVTATGNTSGPMNNYAFTIDQDNVQKTTAFVGATGLPKTCWIYKAKDAC